jgi:hypothetical protein
VTTAIGNPPRSMTPAQARTIVMFDEEAAIMLALLAGRSPYAVGRMSRTASLLHGMQRRGWVTSADEPTAGGRDALAVFLLRGFRGPVVVVDEQPVMFAEDARAMLAIVTGRPLVAPTWVLAILSHCRWVEFSRISHGKLIATPLGRDALAAYLLRGWRP